jgi:uncharacterized integral membrane protein (TIGR00698 family)
MGAVCLMRCDVNWTQNWIDVPAATAYTTPVTMSQTTQDYSWAAYLDYMEGGGSDVLTLPPSKSPAVAAKKAEPVWPGILAALTITILALSLAQLAVWPFSVTTATGKVTHPLEPVMIAIILGMVAGNLWQLPKSLHVGIKYSVKKILPLGIVLLGARLHFGDLLKVGAAGLILSAVETAFALCLLWLLARWMNLPHKLGILLGVGTAICGGTAIVATAPVIEAEEKDVVFSVATVTLLGLIAMFVLPVVGHMLELTSKQFGVWAGLAIHQTPQVVAAGYAYSPANAPYSPAAGDTATIVKLARVCLLAPVVFIIGFLHARSKAAEGGGTAKKKIDYLHLFPMFVLGFLGMALLKTLGLIPDLTVHNTAFLGDGAHTLNLGAAAEHVSRFCIVISMAGVGLETKFSAMKQTGAKPVIASLVAALAVAVLVLCLIEWLKI